MIIMFIFTIYFCGGWMINNILTPVTTGGVFWVEGNRVQVEHVCKFLFL